MPCTLRREGPQTAGGLGVEVLSVRTCLLQEVGLEETGVGASQVSAVHNGESLQASRGSLTSPSV